VLIAKIQELYIIVYQKEKITNNIIALRFTMGLLVKKKKVCGELGPICTTSTKTQVKKGLKEHLILHW
jgi:hypothetical protein